MTSWWTVRDPTRQLAAAAASGVSHSGSLIDHREIKVKEQRVAKRDESTFVGRRDFNRPGMLDFLRVGGKSGQNKPNALFRLLMSCLLTPPCIPIGHKVQTVTAENGEQ